MSELCVCGALLRVGDFKAQILQDADKTIHDAATAMKTGQSDVATCADNKFYSRFRFLVGVSGLRASRSSAISFFSCSFFVFATTLYSSLIDFRSMWVIGFWHIVQVCRTLRESEED